MTKILRVKVVGPLALLALATLQSLIYAQERYQTVKIESQRSDTRQKEWLAKLAAISGIHNNEEKLVRGAYAKLTRYQHAYVAEKADANKRAPRREDSVEFEFSDFHTGPIEEMVDAQYSEIVTEPVGDILSVTPSYRNQPNDPKFAVYIVKWTKGKGESVGGTGITVGEILGLVNGQPTDVDFYASYAVTVRLAGKERAYRAMALYHKAYGSGGGRRVEIRDNITPAINDVMEDKSPVVRSPWRTYVTSPSYFATVRTIVKAREEGVSPIDENSAMGTLPGDYATPNEQDQQKSRQAVAALCSACIVGGTPLTVTSLSPAEVHVSTGDAASDHTLALQFASSASVYFNFPVGFLYNVGGVSRSVLTVPSNYGFSPVTTTVQARDPAGSPGSSGVFVVHPECGGQVFPQQSIVIVPPQILLQMMKNEARGLPSSTARIFLGWSIRNRFNDAMFGSPTTYYAAITCSNCATYDTSVTTGIQPELDAAASVFNGANGDASYGSQGWWSPTDNQWVTVNQALVSGTATLPTGVGIPFTYNGHPEMTQIVYFSSVGFNTVVGKTNAPAFLFVRRRDPNANPPLSAVVKLD